MSRDPRVRDDARKGKRQLRPRLGVQAGYESGIRIFDSSLGGLGGCPFAPGASGNAATEDLVAWVEASGVATGIDLEALLKAAAWVERDLLKRSLPSRLLRARLGGGRSEDPPGAREKAGVAPPPPGASRAWKGR
jgi:hypothetical protein